MNKKILLLLLSYTISGMHSQNKIKCIESDTYKIMANGKLAIKKGNVAVCFNEYAFSFITEESGLITFEIETQSRQKYQRGTKMVDGFLNTESKTNRRGDYSVDISQGSEIEITINYPSVQNGYAILVTSKSWVGGKELSLSVNENLSSIKKIESDSTKTNIKKTSNTTIVPVEQNEIIYTIAGEQAEYVGGPSEMSKYINKNFKYPTIAKEKGITGKCFLKFVVSSDGSIKDIQVIKGVDQCPECDQEAIRIIKGMPNWKPGKVGGKAVSTYYNYPFQFRLD